MKRYQYRCDRCLVLEERLLFSGQEPLYTVPCPKCGGPAVAISDSDSKPRQTDMTMSAKMRPDSRVQFR